MQTDTPPPRTATLWYARDPNRRLGYFEGDDYDKFLASPALNKSLMQRDAGGHEHYAVTLAK